MNLYTRNRTAHANRTERTAASVLSADDDGLILPRGKEWIAQGIFQDAIKIHFGDASIVGIRDVVPLTCGRVASSPTHIKSPVRSSAVSGVAAKIERHVG